MKRMLCLFLCVLLAAGALASCGSKSPAQVILPELNGKPELSLEVVTMESTWPRKTVTVRLTNCTEHTVLYGKDYQLLRYDGTSWEQAKYISRFWNRSVTLEAYRLRPGESEEITFTLTSRHFVNMTQTYCLTMRLSEEQPSGGYIEYSCGVLLEPGAWQ